jgi:hypothetical protein
MATLLAERPILFAAWLAQRPPAQEPDGHSVFSTRRPSQDALAGMRHGRERRGANEARRMLIIPIINTLKNRRQVGWF